MLMAATVILIDGIHSVSVFADEVGLRRALFVAVEQ